MLSRMRCYALMSVTASKQVPLLMVGEFDLGGVPTVGGRPLPAVASAKLFALQSTSQGCGIHERS